MAEPKEFRGPGQGYVERQEELTLEVTTGTVEPTGQPQTAVVTPVAETAPVPTPAVSPLPVAKMPAAAPAAPQTVPAQTGNRAPAQGYYPQQRRPAYPQYYYR